VPRQPDSGTLTPRQFEYLTLAAEGLTQAQIAQHMHCTEDTVTRFARYAFRHLGAVSVAHAVHIAHQRGILGGRPASRTLVPAGPTLDAIHRMLAAGWPLVWQAREARVSAAAMHRLLGRQVVLSSTEARVLAAAGRLLRLDPLETGVDPRVVARARNEARRRGWAAQEAKAA
jgi:DNA-binding CsgD family transcriptional regulator